MNIFLNEYFGFCFELNFELNHFSARFNEKMNFQNVSNRATLSAQALLARPLRAGAGKFIFCKIIGQKRPTQPSAAGQRKGCHV